MTGPQAAPSTTTRSLAPAGPPSPAGIDTGRRWCGPGGVVALFTGRSEGDLGHGGRYVHEVEPNVARRRQAVLDRPWSWIRQVHGARVVRVDEPGGGTGEKADALVSTHPGAALAVLTADCAPVAFASDEGVFAAAHAGWRGTLAGVIEDTVAAMRAAGAGRVRAAVGPCIGAECYAFGSDDLDAVAERLGSTVRGETADGSPALDLRAAVVAALGRAGVTDVDLSLASCTACSPGYFSHRARGERERQAMVVWRP